jgi:hypothetical protein
MKNKIATLIKNLNHKQNLLLTYKLLYDVAFILLFLFSCLTIAEGLLPNFLSSHLNTTSLILVLLLILIAIGKLGEKLNLHYSIISIRKKKSIPFLVIIIILLLGGSILKFPLWENLLIVSGMLCLLFLFYRIMLRAEH